MDLLQLWEQRSHVVRLRFRDGEEIDARLLGTDPPVHAELTYEVVRIHAPGQPPAQGTAVGAIVVASTDDLVDWQRVRGEDDANPAT